MSPRARIGTEQFSPDQLLLKVSEDVDPSRFNIDAYDAFLRRLVGERHYQREAIEKTAAYLCGGEYQSTADLARKSYEESGDLQRGYATAEKLVAALTFPDLLDCSLDLATGTGKSFVLYGIARIALNEGLVDRVLLLCPSLTIEDGLRDKFNTLTADGDLTDLLPDRTGTRLPDIVTAQSTVREGQICIENIHATFKRTASSIRDSFIGSGERTLILSDEAHHVHGRQQGRRRNKEEEALGRWREFVGDPDYGFRYHVGVSGTCWVGNDYFSDVIYHYSLREAMDDRWIKDVLYLKEDNSPTDDTRFQKLLKLHEQNRTTYGLKPLSICVTRDIDAAVVLHEQLVDFLAGKLKGGREEARRKVLIVTSEHKKNVPRLKTVDSADDPVEWIVSVSMLTEGWDVKNVFLIYPHEKRAFDSKLLIAQVLGRGLRKPNLPGGGQGTVRVFNHQRWGPQVAGYVSEIIDKETEIAQRPTEREAAPHFELHDLKFKTAPTSVKPTNAPAPKDIERLTLRAQGDREEETIFESVRDPSRTDVLTTMVREKHYELAAVVSEVRRHLLDRDKANGTEIAKAYPKKRVEGLIRQALDDLDVKNDEVSQDNFQKILREFGRLQQKTTRPRATLDKKPVGFEMRKTSEMHPVRGRIAGLTSNLGLFYDSKSGSLGTPEDGVALSKAAEMDESDTAVHITEIVNSFHFRSPVNVVLTSHSPERRFAQGLLKPSPAEVLESWVKAPDSGFYKIDYSYQGTGGMKRGSFNPDFFLLLKTGDVVVVETKADDDESPRNAGKLEWAARHFAKVNEMLQEAGEARRYHFHFLSPQDYSLFFQHLQDGTLDEFTSSLQAALKSA